MELPALRQHVWLVLPRSPEVRLASTVEDTVGPIVHLAMPEGTDATSSIRPDEKARLQYFDADGQVRLDGTVVDIGRNGQLVRFCPTEATGQRRQFLRWEADLPIQLRYLDEGDAHGTDGGGAGWFRARLVDIGGGGVAVRVGKPIDTDRPLAIQVRLPTGAVMAEGIVVTQRQEGASSRSGLRFTRITDAARSRIVRFVFQEELRWRHGLQGETLG